MPGLRGRWELCAWRPHWLRLGGGALPPSDGPPAPRSSRLQQGHLHPDGSALLAALHCSLAEVSAARLAMRHKLQWAGTVQGRAAAGLGWLDLPLQCKAGIYLQRVASCMSAWLAVPSTGNHRGRSAVLPPNYEWQGAPLPYSTVAKQQIGGPQCTSRCYISPSIIGASAAASARLLRELLWSPARGPLCCGASTGWEVPAPKSAQETGESSYFGHYQPGKLALAAAASLIAAAAYLARHGTHCQQ